MALPHKVDGADASGEAAESDLDAGAGEGEGAFLELLGDAFGGLAGQGWMEKIQELRSSTSPRAASIEERLDGFEHGVGRRRSEGWLHGLPDIFWRAAQGRGGGHSPGLRIG